MTTSLGTDAVVVTRVRYTNSLHTGDSVDDLNTKLSRHGLQNQHELQSDRGLLNSIVKKIITSKQNNNPLSSWEMNNSSESTDKLPIAIECTNTFHLQNVSEVTDKNSSSGIDDAILDENEILGNCNASKLHNNKDEYSINDCESTLEGESYIRPFSCKICNRSFTANKSLTRHMSLHIEESRSKHCCGVCGKKFREAYNLKMHMFVHTGGTLIAL